MPTRAPKNLYRGVNPHLNSLLQRKGTRDKPSQFEGFHGTHIRYIQTYLNRHLPSNYIADSDQSLQITSSYTGYNPQPDVSIIREFKSGSAGGTRQGVLTPPTLRAKLNILIAPEDEMRAVAIRKMPEAQIVTWIELLSPGNKPPSSHAPMYQLRRNDSMKAQIPLVELDFLHERKPIVNEIPAYPKEPDSYPYYISVTDSRPEFVSFLVYGVHIDQPLPNILLPLDGDETVEVNFDDIYQSQFEVERLHMRTDYAQLPERFETYSADDQARIKTRMAEIAQEHGDKQS